MSMLVMFAVCSVTGLDSPDLLVGDSSREGSCPFIIGASECRQINFYRHMMFHITILTSQGSEFRISMSGGGGALQF